MTLIFDIERLENLVAKLECRSLFCKTCRNYEKNIKSKILSLDQLNESNEPDNIKVWRKPRIKLGLVEIEEECLRHFVSKKCTDIKNQPSIKKFLKSEK